MMTATAQERLIEKEELAELLGYSPAYVEDIAQAGLIPSYKLPGRSNKTRRKFLYSEVLEAIKTGWKAPTAAVG